MKARKHKWIINSWERTTFSLIILSQEIDVSILYCIARPPHVYDFRGNKKPSTLPLSLNINPSAFSSPFGSLRNCPFARMTRKSWFSSCFKRFFTFFASAMLISARGLVPNSPSLSPSTLCWQTNSSSENLVSPDLFAKLPSCPVPI